MADTKTTEKVEQAYYRAEDTVSSMFDTSRKAFHTMFEFNHKQLNTTLQLARDIQDESLRLTDAWLDQVTRYQKNTMKSFQDYTVRFQDYTEKTVKDTQSRVEESVDKTLELVTPAGRSARR